MPWVSPFFLRPAIGSMSFLKITSSSSHLKQFNSNTFRFVNCLSIASIVAISQGNPEILRLSSPGRMVVEEPALQLIARDRDVLRNTA